MAIKPGENLAYVKDLIKRYEAAVKKVQKAELPTEVSEIEREIHPVIKEMQLAIPRVWNDFNIILRERRAEIRDSVTWKVQ